MIKQTHYGKGDNIAGSVVYDKSERVENNALLDRLCTAYKNNGVEGVVEQLEAQGFNKIVNKIQKTYESYLKTEYTSPTQRFLKGKEVLVVIGRKLMTWEDFDAFSGALKLWEENTAKANILVLQSAALRNRMSVVYFKQEKIDAVDEFVESAKEVAKALEKDILFYLEPAKDLLKSFEEIKQDYDDVTSVNNQANRIQIEILLMELQSAIREYAGVNFENANELDDVTNRLRSTLFILTTNPLFQEHPNYEMWRDGFQAKLYLHKLITAAQSYIANQK